MGFSARELDATPMWQVGAMLRAPKSPEDETLDVFAERMAAAQGLGPEPEPRSMPTADIIQFAQIAQRRNGPA